MTFEELRARAWRQCFEDNPCQSSHRAGFKAGWQAATEAERAREAEFETIIHEGFMDWLADCVTEEWRAATCLEEQLEAAWIASRMAFVKRLREETERAEHAERSLEIQHDKIQSDTTSAAAIGKAATEAELERIISLRPKPPKVPADADWTTGWYDGCDRWHAAAIRARGEE